MSRYRVSLLAAIVLALPLFTFTYMGFFARYLADDFCIAGRAQQHGVIGSAVMWYMTWAGQYTNWLIKGVVGLLGPGVAMILPVLILLGWVAAASWTFYQIGMLLRVRNSRLTSILLGVALTYAVFSGAPDRIQSLYWLSATIPYTLPLISLIFYLGFFLLMLRQNPDGTMPKWAHVFTAVLAFITGGVSEAYVLFQAAILGLMLIGVWVIVPTRIRRGRILLVSVGLVFSVLAFVVILVAPGNAIRQAMFGDTLPLSEIIIRTLRVSASFFATDIAVFSPIPLLVALCLPALVISQFTQFEIAIFMPPRRTRSLMLLSLGVGLLLELVVIGPPIYATSVAPAPRVYFAAHLVMVCVAGFWGCVIGLGLNRRGASVDTRPSFAVLTVLVVLLAVGPVLTTLQTLNEIPVFRTFASDWDRRDTLLHQAAAQGREDIVVQPLSVDLGTLAGLDIIEQDPSGWVNVCVAEYYNVGSISAASS